MATVLITGGTGLLGTHLYKKLKDKGYQVGILSRTKPQKTTITTYTYHPDKNEIESGALEKADYIIHLAGANVGEKRWTAKRKQEIIDSRVKTGELLFDKIKEKKIKLKAFISASAVGYYGTVTSDKIFTESDPPGDDFLGETCRQWEEMADKFQEPGTRVVKIRTGIVLTKQGGAIAKMLLPIKMGMVAALGSGKQYMPWIHIDDLCNIYIKAIEDHEMKGAYNAVAPEHKTNQEFTRTLAEALHKSYWLSNVPAFILKFLFGEMAEIILKGSRISADKIKNTGYLFQFPKLEIALTNLMGNEKQ